MTSDERKMATASLIPLEIDAASILSLSKGVIFDTIVHNIEHTLSDRRTDPLPWKLTGMSLICDASRNKKYVQKLQKMQCVPSVICTEIYHSKLLITDSGSMTTPGRKIVIPTAQRKRLTGIIVSRSIDELLHMEPKTTSSVHFIQYKLLSYERMASREIVNGPRLPSMGDKILKTVFDFELTQNNGFPRQLLPVAIISFLRQDGCNLCSSIRNFLNLEEHKTFDKSYLVTSTNSEWTRLREQQEQREEDEAEMESLWEKIERRQPLADLSEKTTETANARPVTTNQPAPRVPPLKIKLPGPEKTVRPPVIVPPLNSKYYCDLKLERVDLSLYNISNLPTAPVPETKVANKNSAPSNGAKIKPKPPVVTKPYEHRKPLKRLNSSDPKKSSPSASSSSSSTSPTDLPRPKQSSSSIRSISTDTTSSSIAGKSKTPSITTTAEHRQASLNSSAPQTKSSHSTVKSGEQATTQKKLKRPQLPAEYRCSLPISRLNLSLYNLPIPPATTPMVTERRTTELLSSSRSSVQQMECATASLETNISPDTTEPTLAMELENREESNSATIVSSKALEDSHPDEVQPSSIDQVLTPETFDSSSSMSNDDTAALSLNILPPALLKELSSIPECDVPSPSVNESDINKSVPTMNDEMQPISENTNIISAFSDTSACINSLELPALEDDASLFPMASLENTSIDPLTLISQDCMIIVECSDHEDEFDADDNDVLNEIENLMTSADSEKIALASPSETTSFSRSLNPLLNRVLATAASIESPRLSTSSSCSSLSASMLYNQSPRTSLYLREIHVSKLILKKQQQAKSRTAIALSRTMITIPFLAQESLIDPRLIYRLQTITTDLRWPTPCGQCSILPHLPSLFTSSTQTITADPKYSTDFLDPRRESLRTAILNNVYHRLTSCAPNLFTTNPAHVEKLLFEETTFNTNCSLHLEYLLHKITIIDDSQFFNLIKSNEEFQVSPLLLLMFSD